MFRDGFGKPREEVDQGFSGGGRRGGMAEMLMMVMVGRLDDTMKTRRTISIWKGRCVDGQVREMR